MKGIIIIIIKYVNGTVCEYQQGKQAGAELCQAQAQLGLHAKTTTNHNLH